MTLHDLMDRVGLMVPLQPVGDAATDRRVSAIEYDSRRVPPGAVFFALRGRRADGNAFAEQALSRGAQAVVAEAPPPAGWTAPWYVTTDARRALAATAAVFFRHPSDDLVVVGITGTNGKTTTSYLLTSIFEAAGFRCGRLGTVTYRVGSVEREAARTTPEAPDVQRLLREMVDERCAACVMEVSSHALALSRVDFLHFAAGLFTNLTRDHLDFHGGMEDYFLAKRRLAEMLPEGAPLVVNLDDAHGARLAREFPRAVTYALDRPASVSAPGASFTLDGLSFDVRTTRGTLKVRSGLIGRPNAYNVVSAVATAVALDLPFAAIESGIAAVAHVPGRFQTVSGAGDDIAVIVDYAHTDDALRNLLETTRPLARGRLITVFGCGGDRDRTKRPLMGAVAARLSDLVVLTSDNPRSEDPAAIVDEIKAGIVQPERPLVRHGQPVPPASSTPWTAVVDRGEAIAHAISGAAPGDLVVVAGKGHEKYQEVGGRVLPFDDVEVAREALSARRSRTASAPSWQA